MTTPRLASPSQPATLLGIGRTAVFMLFAGLLIFPTQAQTPGASTKVSPVKEMTKLLDEAEARGYQGYVRVEKHGKPIFERSMGYANRATKLRWTADTVIEIGSIVKPMSSIALWTLENEGRLSMSDPLSKYLPLTGDVGALPLALVQAHRAGLPDVFGDDYDALTREQLLEKVNGCKLLFKPDTNYRYSNCGFSLLAMVIEKITGKTFEQYVRETEFAKAKTPSIGYVLPKWNKTKLIHGYETDGKDWGSPLDHFWFKDGPAWNLRGNGGMLSTSADLMKWARNVGTPDQVISKAVLTKWNARIYGPEAKKEAAWAYAGGNGYFDTVIYFIPDLDLTVLACSNTMKKEIEDYIKPILKLGRQMGSEK